MRRIDHLAPHPRSIWLAVMLESIAVFCVGVFVSPVPAAAEPSTVSVRDFGAKGDGVTDDSRSIQLALRAGTTPRTVVFPAGDYVFKNALVGSDTTIRFDEGAIGSAPVTATSADVFFSVLGTTIQPVVNVKFSGGAFRGRPAIGGVVVAKYARGLDVSDVRSTDVTKNVSANLSSDITVRDCVSRGGRWGFAFERSSRIEVRDCRSSHTLRDGILFYGRSQFVTATDNFVEDYMTGGDVGVGGIQVYGSTMATISRNTVINGHYDSAGIRFRDADRFWCEGNYVCSPGSSGLQVVRVGDYPGLDGGDGAFVGNVVERPHLFGVDVANRLSKPVRVVGNVILDLTTTSRISAATGVVVVPAGSTVIGNRVEVATGPGIQTGGSGSVTAWNRVHESASVNFGPRVGVFVSGGTGHAVVGNEVRDHTVRMQNGVRLYYGTTALLRGNVVDGASRSAYDIRGAQVSTLRGDTAPPRAQAVVSSTGQGLASVRISANDALSRVVALRASVDGGPPAFFDGPVGQLTVSGTGAHVVSYAALDQAGNQSAPGYLRLGVSDYPPNSRPTSVTAFMSSAQNGPSPPPGSVVTLLSSVRDSSGAPVNSKGGMELQRFVNGTWVTRASLGEAAGGLSYRAVLTEGLYRFRFRGDAANAPSTSRSLHITPLVYETVAGKDRIETSVAASRASFPSRSDAVVITTGYGFADALAGSTLAGVLRAPVLLTTGQDLSEAVSQEVTRLGAKRAVIIGGEAAVSRNIAICLGQLVGAGGVTRIAGADRYDTAAKVAEVAVGAKRVAGGQFDGVVLIATGADFPDALAASPLAAAKGWPILLTTSRLTTPTTNVLSRIGAKRAYVVGGPGAVPERVLDGLRGVLGSRSVSRVAGSTRYETAAEIAGVGVANGMNWDGVALATGENYPDALAGGVMQGHFGSVMLLTRSATLDAFAGAALGVNTDHFKRVRYLGGPTALSSEVRAAVTDVLW